VRVTLAHRPRRREERRRGDVEQAVQETGAPRFPLRLAPVGEPGDRGAKRAGQPDAHRERRGATPALVAVRRAIERQRRRPCAERKIGEHRMQRMAEPDAVRRVLQLLPGRACRLIGAAHRLAQRLGNAIERGAVDDLHQRIGTVHRSS
jgi:hypothetical protein